MNKIQLALETATDVLVHAATTGHIKSSDELAANRMTICSKCELYTGTTCRACGCVMSVKTKLEAAKCPRSMW